MTRRILLAMCVALTACSTIPLDNEPVRIVADVEPPSRTVDQVSDDLAAAPLFLVREDELLTRVTRDLAAPLTAENLMRSLLDGATPPEVRSGLRTSIPADTRLLGVRTMGEVIHVDVSRDFASVGGIEELLSVAQIVLTLTSFEDVKSVSFELGGVPTDVPVASGALSAEPVSAEDYLDLVGS